MAEKRKRLDGEPGHETQLDSDPEDCPLDYAGRLIRLDKRFSASSPAGLGLSCSHDDLVRRVADVHWAPHARLDPPGRPRRGLRVHLIPLTDPPAACCYRHNIHKTARPRLSLVSWLGPKCPPEYLRHHARPNLGPNWDDCAKLPNQDSSALVAT